MVAGDTHLCDMGAIAMSRIALLRRGIADQWVGLLIGNGVESETAPGPVRQHRDSPGPTRLPHYRKGAS
jgi:hypothetical protein